MDKVVIAMYRLRQADTTREHWIQLRVTFTVETNAVHTHTTWQRNRRTTSDTVHCTTQYTVLTPLAKGNESWQRIYSPAACQNFVQNMKSIIGGSGSYFSYSLPSPPLSERRRYCDARRPCLCVCVSAEPRLHAALISAAKVTRCIQCSLAAFTCTRRSSKQHSCPLLFAWGLITKKS